MGGSFGAFGKMPALGDFFRFGLPMDFVEAWDRWLQTSMLGARETLGPGWDERYLTSPIWRFALGAGVAGASPMIGVVMPSVDRVGRQFPLTLAASIQTTRIGLAFFGHTQMFSDLEALALDALDDDASKDRLMTDLGSVQVPMTRDQIGSGPVVWPGAMVSNTSSCEAIAARSIDNEPSIKSLWASVVDGEHRFLACTGLPNAREATSLFDLDAPSWNQSVEGVSE